MSQSPRSAESSVEVQDTASVLAQLAGRQAVAAAAKPNYGETVTELEAAAKALEGRDVLLTGTLSGRRGLRVYDDDPTAIVRGLVAKVVSVQLHASESSPYPQLLPYVSIVAREADEPDVILWGDMHPLGLSVTPAPKENPGLPTQSNA